MNPELKLFMVLLGSKAPDRVVEQHDYFFGIAASLKDLVNQIRNFWPEAGNSLHIDGWREVTWVDGYAVKISPKDSSRKNSGKRLFFVNLGGYQSGKLEEQHYILLTVQDDRKGAIKSSTMTSFFKNSSIAKIKSASAHIDEKYGIDVDDVYRIDDVLLPEAKNLYDIDLIPAINAKEDEIHLGYFKLDSL
ncbi:DUF1543 domain-containing protein [Pararcticibacter amylolyticus]|uniref:DUF1543 domain-containing protein n=1 Tax=Pararcticibacter amylolyticus TaxID=2173175 RepID=A0A2U2PKV4_9SPHI|nr:DUF1543 domain-containing protein [Pararcticibacter amylolyticus]PWG81958.1 DUF1543 domain-containing protein [Pararcticibacter amylolyticus]